MLCAFTFLFSEKVYFCAARLVEDVRGTCSKYNQLQEMLLLPEMGLQNMFSWWTNCRDPSKLPTRYVIKGIILFNICSSQQQACNTQSSTLDVSCHKFENVSMRPGNMDVHPTSGCWPVLKTKLYQAIT
jgi:hypothetical protein